MGERFRGGGWYSSRSERNPDVEAKEHLDAINRLLAKLIETGGDLPSDVKQGLRSQIQAHLQVLGLESLEDYVGLTAIQQRLHERSTNLPAPINYPSREDFRQSLQDVYKLRGQEDLPTVPGRPRATQIAQFGQADWTEIQGRGGIGVVDYLYNLGKVMSSQVTYTTAFDRTDPIEVANQWRVENGRHRALTLRVLGAQFVDEQSMDGWVLARREQ